MSKLILLIAFSLVAIQAAVAQTGTTLPGTYVLIDKWGKERFWSPKQPLTVFADKKPKGYVVFFLKPGCPVVGLYQNLIRKMADEYANAHLQVMGIYSDIGVTRLEMANHKTLSDFPFPVFLDEKGKLAEGLGAVRTPQAFLLNADRKILYAGPIDNAAWESSEQLKEIPEEEHYLKNAVRAFLAGQQISETGEALPSPGCALPSHSRAVDPNRERVKYYPKVEAVIRKQCLGCHWDGGIGPIPLETYEQVSSNAEQIARVVKYQTMPPWSVIPVRKHALVDEKMMSDNDRRLIVQWMEDGALEGNSAESIASAVKRHDTRNFTIGNGKPDLVLEMPEPFIVEPEMKDLDYQFFWIPSATNEDRWIREIEVIAGDPRVVHHLQLHLKPKADRAIYVPKKNNKFVFGPPLSGLNAMAGFYGISGDAAVRVISYLPGNESNTRRLDGDKAFKIPANYDAIIELHYTAVPGEKVADQSKVGIVFAKEKPKHEVKSISLFHPKDLRIPAHNAHVAASHDIYFPEDITILDIRPHMHKRGSDFKVTITPPGGVEETVLVVPAYEFNWQHTYTLKNPIFLKANSIIRCYAHFDNSRLNPNHNLPHQNVFWGQKSDQEMDNLVLTYYIHD